ncbi:MAG: MerR family transcriptional regulator [Lachnospiraceae bacterium]
MSANAKDKFTIHEVAKLNNISIDSLRYYEKIGLLKPSRGGNRYRYYSLDDLVLLNIIREFRSLNFSFGQIKEMLEGRSLKATEELLQQELELVDNEIARLRQTKKTILQRLNNMNSVFCQMKPNTPGIITLPDMKCLHITNGPMKIDEIDYYINAYTLRTNLDLTNIIGRYDVYRLDTAKRINENQYEIKEVLVTNNAMKVKPDIILTGGRYLNITYHGTDFLSGIQVDKLMAYAEEQKITTIGDFFEFRIFDFYDTSFPEEYLSAVCVKIE